MSSDEQQELNINIQAENESIAQIENEVNSIRFTNTIGVLEQQIDNHSEPRSFDFESYYDLNRGQPIRVLALKIGSDGLPRFQCANHKLNLANRRAIDSHDEIKQILRSFNTSNAHIRRVVRKNRKFN